MPESLSVEIKASLAWLWEESLELSTLVDSSKLEVQTALAAGDGPAEADQIWHATRIIAASSNDDLDLTALVQSIHGQSVSLGFAAVKAILIHNTSEEDSLVIDSSVSNSITTPFDGSATSTLVIPASSPLLLVNKLTGWAVTAGTGDNLRISNDGAGEIEYKIVIVGTAA